MNIVPVVIAAFIFALVALVHLVRLLSPFPIILAGYIVPVWISGLAFILSGLMSIWLLRSVYGKNK